MSVEPKLIAEFVSDIWRLVVGRPVQVARLRVRVLQTWFNDPAGAFVVVAAEAHKPSTRRARRNPERPSGINPLSDCETSGRFPQVIAEEYVVVNTPAPRGTATPDDSVR